MWKNIVQPDWSHVIIRALHAGYLRLKSHTQNMQYLFLFLYKNCCTKAPLYYITRTLFYQPHALQANTIILPGLSHNSLLSYRF